MEREKKRYLCMSKRREALQNKNTVSHGETLLQIKWLIPMTMPCIWICIYMTLLHSHTHTTKTQYSIQFFPLDFSWEKEGIKKRPTEIPPRWVNIRINRTRPSIFIRLFQSISFCLCSPLDIECIGTIIRYANQISHLNWWILNAIYESIVLEASIRT